MILTRLNIEKVSSELNQNKITDKLSYMRERILQAFFKNHDFRKTINVVNEEFYNLMAFLLFPHLLFNLPERPLMYRKN